MGKLPANIDYYHSLETLPYLIASLCVEAQQALKGIDSYVVDQSRGRAHAVAGVPTHFTIPLWVIEKHSKDYQLWYVAHEIAHIIDFRTRGISDHSAVFHAILKRICPVSSLKFEVTYMKRAAGRGFTDKPNLEDLI